MYLEWDFLRLFVEVFEYQSDFTGRDLEKDNMKIFLENFKKKGCFDLESICF